MRLPMMQKLGDDPPAGSLSTRTDMIPLLPNWHADRIMRILKRQADLQALVPVAEPDLGRHRFCEKEKLFLACPTFA
jgi:hypothetical protein